MNTPSKLLEKLRKIARDTGGELSWFAERMEGLADIVVKPQPLPACIQLNGLSDVSSEQTRPTVEAIIKAAPKLRWQQSYNRKDGFDDHYLDNYGWFNLVSPEGIFVNNEIRVSVGYWGVGLSYLEHWHQPEEFYLVLAGSAKFLSQGRAPRQCDAGEVIHHRPNQKHAIKMTPGPLLAAAFWRGDGLLTKPDLEEEFS